MRCSKVKDTLGAYLDKELSERKVKRIERHLAKCSACTWELRSFQKINELGQRIAEAELSQLPDGYWDTYITNLYGKLEHAGVHHRFSKFSFLAPYWHFTLNFASYWFKKTAPGLAVAVVVIALAMSVSHFINRPAQNPIQESQKTMPVVSKSTSKEIVKKPVIAEKPSKINELEKITINFYLKEHENAVMQASYSPQIRQKSVELSYDDVFYYDAARGLDKDWQGEAGIFLRAPHRSSYRGSGEPSQQSSNIANDHKLSLQEAQKTVNFRIAAPRTLYPGYFLESIKKIEGKECIHLIYTNGISTLSMFEQTIKSEEKFHSGDFREYVMYSKEDGKPANIISWNNTVVSYTLIGKEDFSYLMDIIRTFQEDYKDKG